MGQARWSLNAATCAPMSLYSSQLIPASPRQSVVGRTPVLLEASECFPTAPAPAKPPRFLLKILRKATPELGQPWHGWHQVLSCSEDPHTHTHIPLPGHLPYTHPPLPLPAARESAIGRELKQLLLGARVAPRSRSHILPAPPTLSRGHTCRRMIRESDSPATPEAQSKDPEYLAVFTRNNQLLKDMSLGRSRHIDYVASYFWPPGANSSD